MAEVLVFYTAIRYWALIPLTLWVVIVRALRYFVSMLMRAYQSAKIVKQGLVVIRARNLRAGANFIYAKSFRANEDQRLASSNSCVLPEDLPVNLNFGFDRKPDLVLGPCDGIFCLYWKPTVYHRVPGPVVCRVERLPTIALWNPATRAFNILPMSQFDFPPYKKVSGNDCMVGFGFDLTTKSIKVVKVVSFLRGEATVNDYINCAEVYDLGSGSWRVLHGDDIVQEVFVRDSPTYSMYNNNDGVFHWYAVRSFRGINFEDRVGLVLSFDMSSELFHVTLMPEKYNIITWSSSRIWKECTFSLLRDSLAVNFSFFKDGRATVELWVMKKDFDGMVEAGESFSSYSWSHELTVEVSNPSPCVSMGFWNKNELLIWKRDWTRYGGTPLLYDIDTKQARDLEFSGDIFLLLSGETVFPAVASPEYKLRTTVADLIAFVVCASSSCEESNSNYYIDSCAKRCLSCLEFLVPITVVLILDLPNDLKRRHDAKKKCTSSLASEFPEDCKFFPADTKDELHKVDLVNDGCNAEKSTLVTGYLHTCNLSANQLVIWSLVPDPMKQEPLLVKNVPDPLAGEQMWPKEVEMPETDRNQREKRLRKRTLPWGSSEYQAAWIVNDSDP
ncbi:hypothetical protein Vadar_006252 [Vaccinium darrowii]|uniref:Uncharacterized protein n=1 Tax=Vaccinium darrowii TaxID=229202 RepID=A0ACB7XYF3_9ERIC|nr:hypothetical protein Vadar_006252 [Vaccinium darrowii]